MTDRILIPTELQSRLVQQGHHISSQLEDKYPTDVWPPPEMIVTVALDPDRTLKPAYRERYFTCGKDEEDEPLLPGEMDFDLPEQFSSALALAVRP